MQTPQMKGWAAAVTLIAVAASAGVGAAGFLVGKGLARFKSEVRTVTVKGLVERDVQSDHAHWTVSFRRASDSLADAQAAIGRDRDAVMRFLRAKGFPDEEIEAQPTRTIDRLAQDFGGIQQPKLRFVVASSVHVRSASVARVRASSGATDELMKEGVILDANGDQRANPRYVLAQFNDLRPQLLAQATRNARSIAQQFAADSGAQVGSIVSANQGNIQIFGADGNDESAAWSPTSTPAKRIRVVSTFEFALR
jgi:hypothetical protein